MKQYLIAFLIIVMLQSAAMTQSTWKDAAYKPEPYRKVMVLAKVSDMAARKQLEDYTVKFLTDKGIKAIPAYGNLNKSDGTSREAFLVIVCQECSYNGDIPHRVTESPAQW